MEATFLDDKGKFSGVKFVYYLKREGSKVTYCNDSPRKGQLPSYYDETKFKRAQEVFHKFKANLLTVQLIGLMTLLVQTNTINIIMMTKKSSVPQTAYFRYKQTFIHVLKWYTSDFSEDSKLWKSIIRVRQMHHAANLQASQLPAIEPITQFELSHTIIGFIGFAIIKPKCFGMGSITDEELGALIHFWRVIGYLFGIEDRFNICRESLEESKEICQGMINIHMKHDMKSQSLDSLHMQFAAVQGIRKFVPILNPKSVLNFAYELVFEDCNERSMLEFPLNIFERFENFIFRTFLKMMQYETFRTIFNSLTEYNRKEHAKN